MHGAEGQFEKPDTHWRLIYEFFRDVRSNECFSCFDNCKNRFIIIVFVVVVVVVVVVVL